MVVCASFRVNIFPLFCQLYRIVVAFDHILISLLLFHNCFLHVNNYVFYFIIELLEIGLKSLLCPYCVPRLLTFPPQG